MHELAERGDVVLPADERRQLDRQVVTVRVERAQWARDAAGSSGWTTCHTRSGRPRSFRRCVPRSVERHVLRQPIDDQARRRVRHEDLVAVADRSQASAADHRLTEVVALVAQLRLAGVDRHAHVEIGALGGQGSADEASLGVDRRGHGIGRRGERGDHAVALSLLHRPHAAVARR